MKEADVQRWIQDYLRKHFGTEMYLFKVPQGQYTSRRGIPDLVMSIRGKFYAIEVKMPAGKLTKLQHHEILKINESGAYAFTIYGKDKPVLDSFIRSIKDGSKDNEKRNNL